MRLRFYCDDASGIVHARAECDGDDFAEASAATERAIRTWLASLDAPDVLGAPQIVSTGHGAVCEIAVRGVAMPKAVEASSHGVNVVVDDIANDVHSDNLP